MKINTKINPNIFQDQVDVQSMRYGLGLGLVEAAKQDSRIVALCADLAESTQMSVFRDQFPDRFIEVGVAEQNLAASASGMAAMGKIPFIASYAVFSPGRNWEQIRTTICYNDVPVKIVGSHAGVSVGPDGGTHQALEDIAITRVLPRMTVISPCDYLETKKAIIAVAKTKDPTYIRLARDKTPIITNEDTPFEIGKAQVLFDCDKCDVGIIATGALLYKALRIAKRLHDNGKNIAVMNLSTIKPLDESAIHLFAQKSGALVTVEEHEIYGGMGSAIAELLAKSTPIPIEFIGVNDKYGQSGTANELLEYYGMGEKDIEKAIDRAILRKNK